MWVATVVAQRRDVLGEISARVQPLVRRPFSAALILVALYGVVAFANPTDGYLSDDVSGQVAMMESMARSGELQPDIGYWAAEWDPDGDVHPSSNVFTSDDRWMTQAIWPMIYAGYPLYRLGGYRLALLLPIAGALATAFAARELSRRIRPGISGWAAFWAVALLSPLALYAVSFWGHTVGAAFALWSIVLALLATEARSPVRGASLGTAVGVFFALGGAIRNELFIYAVLVIGVTGVRLLAHRRVGVAVVFGSCAAAGGIAVMQALAALDRFGAGVDRATRAEVGLKARTGGVGNAIDALGDRFYSGAVNTVALLSSTDTVALVAGLVATVGAWCAIRYWATAPLVARTGAAAAGLLYLLWAYGLAYGELWYVPGALVAAPLAVAGLAIPWRSTTARWVGGLAVVATAGTLAVNHATNEYQWGGRYLLVGTLLSIVIAATYLDLLAMPVRRAALTAAAVMVIAGLAWTNVRGNAFADAANELGGRDEPVLIWAAAFGPRESPAHLLDQQWLRVDSLAEVSIAVDVVEAAGFGEFGLVETIGGAPFGAIAGYETGPTTVVTLRPGLDYRVTTYTRAD